MCRGGGIWELSVLVAQLCCEPKMSFVTKIYERERGVALKMGDFLSGCAALKVVCLLHF